MLFAYYDEKLRDTTSRVVLLALTLLISMAVSISTVNAEGCKRKGDFGCCGNGPCNIFCCNCDRGCNKQCENTQCDTGEWFICAGVCTACAAACVVTEGEACIGCMGPMYITCKKCYSSSSSAIAKTSSKDSNRDDFFKSIAKKDGNSKSISFPDFKAFVEAEKKRTGIQKTTAPISGMYKVFDTDSNGVIDRKEFDNESVHHGLDKSSGSTK